MWERLSDVLIRVVTANGQSSDQAHQADICRAIADRTVEIRVKLKRHVTRATTSSETLPGSAFQIPMDLKPDDLDWEQSRPKVAWLVPRDRGYRVHGYWELALIEVSRADVTAELCGGEDPVATETTPARSTTTGRTRPVRESALRAIDELYAQGKPSQSSEPNKKLCSRVNDWLKDHGMHPVSHDTILRAAKRRK
jgi:hypothetical protein